MQKIMALIFLTIFSAIQHGKLISYWNCKITNTSDTRAVQCDCEKILTDTNGDQDSNLLSRTHVKDKTEEWLNIYKYPCSPKKCLIPANSNVYVISSSPTAGFTRHVFQPPKIS
ncbi:MAG: hypothetical protein H7122_12660 [Chitinophagaceae bacterium]|nr:hypothetical protein [Chitinophagaceae bacterium]